MALCIDKDSGDTNLSSSLTYEQKIALIVEYLETEQGRRRLAHSYLESLKDTGKHFCLINRVTTEDLEAFIRYSLFTYVDSPEAFSSIGRKERLERMAYAVIRVKGTMIPAFLDDCVAWVEYGPKDRDKWYGWVL